MQMMLISELQVHPENLGIFGKDEKNVARLVPSIKEHGVLTPLIVTPGGLIISGKCRYYAALKVGLTELPVEVRVYRDELDEIDAIINTNEQRELSKEQKVRVGRKKEWMVKERAKKSQLSHLKQFEDITVSQTFDKRGRSTDTIAQMVGFGSGYNYEKADQVVAVIDKLPEAKAQVLRALLEKSTETAYRVVKEGLVDRLIPDIIVKLQNEDVPAIRIYRKIKQAENAEELREELRKRELEDDGFVENPPIGEIPCRCTPEPPLPELLKICPACGIAIYNLENNIWQDTNGNEIK